MDLRCDNGILHGVILPEEGLLEVKCRSRRCGHGDGAVVFHRFDLQTGNLKGTLQFKDPANRKEAGNDQSSVRSA
jgi:hypothetical protein